MSGDFTRGRASNASPLLCIFSLLFVVAFVSACGGGTIGAEEIVEGSVLGKRPATMREDHEPVTGTVVTRGSNDQILAETEYEDGFPNGRMREWYADGQAKIDRTVRFVDRGNNGGGLEPAGDYKAWCENGTLRIDQSYNSDGKPKGLHQTWACSGELLSQQEMPAGKYTSWVELQDGGTVIAEEGTRLATGHWDGEHKQYNANGTLILEETWRSEKLDGDYKRYHPTGVIQEAGHYKDGVKVGIWAQSSNNVFTYWDYDPENFAKQDYVSAFMQAAGIAQVGSMRIPNYKVDQAKIKYYVGEGLIDPKKKLNADQNSLRSAEFKSRAWTYPYVLASRDALPLLLELGADPKAVDSYQRNRLHYCVDSLGDGLCTAEEIKQLIDMGLDANLRDYTGSTTLHLLMNLRSVIDKNARWANQRRKANLSDLGPYMNLLLEAGADPDVQAVDGSTPAVLALQAEMYDVAAALLERSKNPTLTDEKGFNLIHHAFLMPGGYRFRLDLTDERRAFIDLAAKKGVDPAQKLSGGDTLIDIAEQNGAIELAQYLKKLKT